MEPCLCNICKEFHVHGLSVQIQSNVSRVTALELLRFANFSYLSSPGSRVKSKSVERSILNIDPTILPLGENKIT